MGGSLWVDSEVGKGSRFHFSIRGRVPQVSEDLIKQRMQPFRGKKILYLDTYNDDTGVEQALEQLALHPTIVRSTPDIANISDGLEGGKLPFEAVIVSSLTSVSRFLSLRFHRRADRLYPLNPGSIAQGSRASAFHASRASCTCKQDICLSLLTALTCIPYQRYPHADEQSFLDMPEEIRRHLLLPEPENGEPLPSPIPIRACLDMGITSYYTTPMSVIDLSTAVLPALESHSAPSDELSKESLDILLAEDNAINQKLAVKLLAVGDHRVDIADNGQIAFDKYKAAQERKKPYHVVLVSRIAFSRKS